jgi:hypothetical protein
VVSRNTPPNEMLRVAATCRSSPMRTSTSRRRAYRGSVRRKCSDKLCLAVETGTRCGAQVEFRISRGRPGRGKLARTHAVASHDHASLGEARRLINASHAIRAEVWLSYRVSDEAPDFG